MLLNEWCSFPFTLYTDHVMWPTYLSPLNLVDLILSAFLCFSRISIEPLPVDLMKPPHVSFSSLTQMQSTYTCIICLSLLILYVIVLLFCCGSSLYTVSQHQLSFALFHLTYSAKYTHTPFFPSFLFWVSANYLHVPCPHDFFSCFFFFGSHYFTHTHTHTGVCIIIYVGPFRWLAIFAKLSSLSAVLCVQLGPLFNVLQTPATT